MIFGILTILIAVIISAVSAYYSILGLTAIFAAAVLPVVVMGMALEAGKVMTAVWLHKNWNRAELQYKLYLIPAIGFLMILTSMGVFGFLSKAHLDQTLVSGDVQSRIAIYDEKIKTAKENIESDRRQLKQLDEAVDQVMARSSDEKGADKANAIRKSQSRDRVALARDIEANQKIVVRLSDEAAPIRAEVRKVEAEVGPIKYIAAMLYGDQGANTDTLESAVRWVIVLIVSVFDPLALVLIIAGLKQLEWARAEQEEPAYEADDGPLSEEYVEALRAMAKKDIEKPAEDDFKFLADDKDLYPDLPIACLKCGTTLEDAPGIGPFCPNRECPVLDNILGVEWEFVKPEPVAEPPQPVPEKTDDRVTQAQDEVRELGELLLIKTNEVSNLHRNLDEVKTALVTLNDDYAQVVDKNTAQEEKLMALGYAVQGLEEQLKVVAQERDDIAEAYQALLKQPTVAETVEPVVEPEPESVVEPEPEVAVQPVRAVRADFGSTFPEQPERGDLYLRTDFKPSRLFKWNDVKWIEVNKNTTDAYTYNDMYIQFLAEKLSSGEYTIEELSDVEQQQVLRALGGNAV